MRYPLITAALITAAPLQGSENIQNGWRGVAQQGQVTVSGVRAGFARRA